VFPANFIETAIGRPWKTVPTSVEKNTKANPLDYVGALRSKALHDRTGLLFALALSVASLANAACPAGKIECAPWLRSIVQTRPIAAGVPY
jgi:hypothetical protein